MYWWTILSYLGMPKTLSLRAAQGLTPFSGVLTNSFLNVFTKRKVRLFHQKPFFLCCCCFSSESPLKMIIFFQCSTATDCKYRDKDIFLIYLLIWRLIALQYCGGFCHTLTWISHTCTCVSLSWLPPLLPSPSHSSGLSQSTGFESLVSWIDLGLVSQTVMYMFQCYSLKSSHPHLILRNIEMLVVSWVAI